MCLVVLVCLGDMCLTGITSVCFSLTGQEFMSIKDWLQEEYSIEVFWTKAGRKSVFAEHGVQSTQTKMFCVLYFKNNFDWVNHLDSVQQSLNETPVKPLLNYSSSEIVGDKKKIEEIANKHALDYMDYFKKHNKPERYKVGTTVTEKRLGNFLSHNLARRLKKSAKFWIVLQKCIFWRI